MPPPAAAAGSNAIPTVLDEGTFVRRWGCVAKLARCGKRSLDREQDMHSLIYLIGLIVVILAILSFFGLR